MRALTPTGLLRLARARRVLAGRSIAPAAIALAAGLVGCASTSPGLGQEARAAPQDVRARDEGVARYRSHHASLREDFDHLSRLIGGIEAARGEGRSVEAVRTASRFLERCVRPHAGWEDRAVYPLLDEHVPGGDLLSASARGQHETIERQTQALIDEAARPTPDAVDFARRADQLLGVLRLHLDFEDTLVIPLLERHVPAGVLAKALAEPPPPSPRSTPEETPLPGSP